LNCKKAVDLGADAAGAKMDVVDPTTGENPAQSRTVSGMRVRLAPFAVAVISLAHQ
jgi:hypothetical protein